MEMTPKNMGLQFRRLAENVDLLAGLRPNAPGKAALRREDMDGLIARAVEATTPRLNAVSARTTPTGAVAIFPAATPPAGYLVLDGATILRADYPALWAFAQASGNLAATEAGKTEAQFGPGDGSTTFSLPDHDSPSVAARPIGGDLLICIAI